MGQTVNLLVYTFGGSNPSSPTVFEGRKTLVWLLLRIIGFDSVAVYATEFYFIQKPYPLSGTITIIMTNDCDYQSDKEDYEQRAHNCNADSVRGGQL